MSALMLALETVIATPILADTKTPSEGINKIWEGLGTALMKVKEGFYALAPEIMFTLGDFWIFLMGTAIFFILMVLGSIRNMIKGV